MDLGIDGRTALVSASSEGIGHAAARRLARAGCRVAINGRSKDRLEAAAEDLRQDGADVVPVQADVSTADGVEHLLSTTREQLDDPDILVANAGGPPPGAFDQTDDGDWYDGFDLTVMSAVRLTRGVLAAMQETGWGRIVYVTSASVEHPIENLVLSNSLRRAVVGMAKTVAVEAGPHGVTVNCVAPGSTATDRIYDLARDRAERAGVPEDEMVQRMEDAIPVGRFADPGEVGAAVAFLCSAPAASITGRVLAVDGGRLEG